MNFPKKGEIFTSSTWPDNCVVQPSGETSDKLKYSYQGIEYVGINKDKNGKLCGDVDLENVLDLVKYITPVPKGIGLLTRAMLLKNVIKSYNSKTIESVSNATNRVVDDCRLNKEFSNIFEEYE